MKPKPLSASYHFTLPVGTTLTCPPAGDPSRRTVTSAVHQPTGDAGLTGTALSAAADILTDVTDAGSASAPRRPPAARDDRPSGVRPLRRIKNRRQAGPLYKIAMVVFTVGLVAILVDAALFASGSRSMPWWIHLITVLAPIGLGLGLLGTILEARRSRD
jgi:hypothetical protein